jgi:hypothetical protein
MIFRSALLVLLTASVAACKGSADNSSAAGRPVDTIQVVFGADSDAAPAPVSADTTSVGQAVDVVARYYRNIDTRNLRAAYDLLAESPDRPTFGEFAKQQESISDVRAATREVGRIEGAAGSQYIEVPATVGIIRKDGTREKQTVVHTLRRSMVDGATAAQRSWRIASVKVSQQR